MRALISVIRTRFSNLLRSRVFLLPFAFTNYFLLGVLHLKSVDRSSCMDEFTVFHDILTVYVIAVAVVLFGAPIVKHLRGRITGEVDRGWRHAVARGIGHVVFFWSVVFVTGAADIGSGALGPETHHSTWSPTANRVLDAWSVAACAQNPSGECSVLMTNEWVPFRTAIAQRACDSGRPDTYAACRIPLEEGLISQHEFCRLDAQRPLDQSVCPFHVRASHRRALGLIVHGERR